MMRGPTKEELVAAARHWMENPPTPADGFHRKVAANALGIVERELTVWPAHEAAAIERLRALLGRDGDFDTLTIALAQGLRDGTVLATDPAVFDHLKRTALAQLSVDQPRYRHELTLPEGAR